nr:MAG TPA: hypothetical protein [Caudoviricetes sp.]
MILFRDRPRRCDKGSIPNPYVDFFHNMSKK